MIRSSRSTLRSTSLATLMVASLALWGCGGGDGGSGTGGGGGAAKGGSAGHASGGSNTGGHAGAGPGGAAGGLATGGGGGALSGAGGTAGSGTTGTGGTAGSGTTGTGGMAGNGTTGGAGGHAGGGGAGAGGAAGMAGAGMAGNGGAGAGGTAGGGGGPAGCTHNSDCGGGICMNSVCVSCNGSDSACVTAYGNGYICVSGSCTMGNCHTADNCNDTTKVCANNTCGACTSNNDCTAAYGTNHVCHNGACIAGNCLAKGDCASSGLVCGAQTAFTCGTCTGDTQCVSEYGANHICNGGVCAAGTCHDSTGCGAGQVCDLTTHTCGGCGSGTAGDTTCQNDTKYGGTYICQNNACIVGNCHTAASCNDTTKVCNNFTCGGCASNTDCTNAYGTNHVCSGGACLSGNCNSSAECGGNQLCVNHACVACTTGTTGDTQCKNDTTYGAMHICLAGQCAAGDCHDTSADCTGGQICGATVAHVCGSCGTGTAGDNACKTNTTAYGSGYICLNGGCTQGDCHDTSNDCTAGKICDATTHTCGNCGGATPDSQCNADPRYTGDICFQGLCGPGNCHASSTDCTGANSGQICGVTLANTCGKCTSDAQCKSDAAYGANDICNIATGQCVSATCSNDNASCTANTSDFCCPSTSGSTCVAGNCCVDNDCGAVGTACVNHTCTACAAVSGNKWYVDPVNGNDQTATGSGQSSGGAVAPGCAFKTITAAIAHMGSTPFTGTQIVIVGAAGSTTGLSSGDTLPLILPTNTTLTTSGGPVTITVPAAGGFKLNNNNSGISGGTGAPLVLDGNNKTGGVGVLVSPGASASTSSIANVTIQNTNLYGIRVTNGTLTVGPGVVVTGSNQDGFLISGGAANINNPSGTETSFTGNGSYGIEVTGAGSVSITGTPGTPVPTNAGTVVVSGNTNGGIRIAQGVGTSGLVTNVINGLVSWGNGNASTGTSADGMRLTGGSKVKVRNSLFLGNYRYALVVSSGANSAAGNDLSGLDIGSAGDPGKNYLQVPLGSSGQNASGGLCVALTACNGLCVGPLTANLSAEGNFMVSTGGVQVDCSTSTATITKGTCGSLRSDGINPATNITTTVDVAGCM